MREKFAQTGRRLSEMVRIPTVSGTDQYEIDAYQAYLKKEFAALFERAEVQPVGDALLLRLAGRGAGETLPVLFTGHMDVVAAEASAWRYPPFSGEIHDGCVHGRGSQDMKGPQCALLSALEQLLCEGWTPEREIWLYLSCDEEVGGQTTQQACRRLMEQGVFFETVFDEGGTICESFMGLVEGKAALFGISEKGSLEYRFTARGSGGHAASPPAGSAIVRLAAFVTDLEQRDLFVRRLSRGNREMLLAAARLLPPEKGETLRQAAAEEAPYRLLHSLTPEAKNLLGATIAFTKIEGGSAYNVMPKKAVLTANVRVACVETKAEITEKLQAAAEQYDLECELVSGTDAAPEASCDGFGYRIMKKSVEEVFPGLPVIPFVLGGGTDSRHFLSVTKEVLRFSPMHAHPWQGRGVHGDNEAADLRDVAEAALCYYTLLKKYL